MLNNWIKIYNGSSALYNCLTVPQQHRNKCIVLKNVCCLQCN